MEEGDYFAIETFGSTGRGRVIEEGACSHYALSQEIPEKYTLQYVLGQHVSRYRGRILIIQTSISQVTVKDNTGKVWHTAILSSVPGSYRREELLACCMSSSVHRSDTRH
jgi:methionine aminopeptidase